MSNSHVPIRLPIPTDNDGEYMRRLINWSFALQQNFYRPHYDEGGPVGTVEPTEQQPESPGLVDRALQFVSQFNPVGTAEAGPLDAARKIAQAGIRAYHGSPHSFDKFDISKIGTGEGAQAYGHGLYFADNEAVARGYREALSPYGRADRPEDIAARLLHSYNGDREGAMEELRRRVDDANARNAPYEGIQRLMQARNIVNTRPEVAGHMYEVNINAHPEHFLDWDKPLSEQSPMVQNYLHKNGLVNFENNIGPSSTGEIKPLGWTQNASRMSGEKFYRRLTEGKFTPEMFAQGTPKGVAQSEATNILRQAGIPGIKYLDAGSRSAGDGSRNYVVFNPDIIDILRRYARGGTVGYDEGGGVNGVEQALQYAKDLADKQSMTHEHGFSGNVEFAPVQLHEPMTGHDFTLGQLPKETASWVNPALNTAASMGPYFTPAAPLAAARDVIGGLREGDPSSVAMSALGLPGRAAKAAVVGASALMPGEAEASFAGQLAKTRNIPMYEKALAMLRNGANREHIYNETEWFPGADNNMRFRISDVGSKLTDKALSEMHNPGGSLGKMSEIFDHPDLYDAYPHLKDILTNVGVQPHMPVDGRYMREIPFISVSSKTGNDEVEGVRAVLLHELQHAIQNHEKFSPGGDPNILGALNYARSAGENEARNTQFHRNIPNAITHVAPDFYPWTPRSAPDGVQPILKLYPYNEQLLLPPS